MTTSSMSTSTSTGQPTGGANGQQSTTEQAKDQAKQVAGVAGDEARSVAGDVRQQARGLLDETRNQVQDQSRTQRDRLVDTLRTFGDDLESMAEQRGGLASDAAREVAGRVRSFGQQLEGREPGELLDDLRSFARRRPGMFLAGSLVAGVVAGRVLRGTRDAAQGDGSGGFSGEYDVTATQGRPFGSSYEPTTTGTISDPLLGQPVTAPSVTPEAYPPVEPGLTSTESGRPVGGP